MEKRFVMLARLRLYADFVVLKHSLFAIPFAYLGAFLATRGLPELRILFWVGLAFIGARSAAMALNNLIDRDIDAKNPRTAGRELPSGRITLSEVWGIIIFSYFLLFFSAYKLDPQNLLLPKLSPIIPLTSVIYPYLKRFTPVSHFVLGLNLAYAPVGGWLAVTRAFNIPLGTPEVAMLLLLFAVTFWVAGFDMIYSLQDIDFDKENGLYSIPTVFGVKAALNLSFAAHVLMLALLVGLMYVLGLGVIFKAGLVVIGILILYEHTLVKPGNFKNIPVAFFNVNAAVSLCLLGFAVAEVMV